VLRHLPALLLLLPLLAMSGCAESAIANYRSADYAPEAAGGQEYEPPGDPFDEDGDDEPTSDDDDDASADPGSEILSYDPEPGSSGHHYRAPIVLEFSAYAAGAWVSLYDAYSNYQMPLEHDWSEDGSTLTATPAHFLEPGADYVVSIDLGEAALEYSFTTSTIGLPLEGGAAAIAGNTYAISFADARSDATPGFASLLAASTGPSWLWSVGADTSDDVDGDGLADLSISTGVGLFDDVWNQDLCTPTASLEAGSSAQLVDPFFATDSGPMTLTVDTLQLDFEGAGYDGDFTSDGSQIVEVGFWGWLVAESVTDLAGSKPVCDWLSSNASLECEACPTGVGECAWIEVDGLNGSLADLEFLEIDADGAEDCGGDPASMLASCSVSGSPRASLLALMLALGGLVATRVRR